MSKLYNKNSSFSTSFLQNYLNLLKHFISSCHFMPIAFLKFLPTFVLSIASKESVIMSDLAILIASNTAIKLDSAITKIKRFLSNSNYDFNFFFHKFISKVLSTYKIKHSDKRIHIIFDHMYVEDRYTILMFTLKIGKQSIPLWFKTFEYGDKEAFEYSLFKEGIDYCFNLIKSVDKDADIIFLADRYWGNHFELMQHIKDLNSTYYFRTKTDTYAWVYDKHDKLILKKTLGEIDLFVYHSKLFNDIPISLSKYPMNLAISKSEGHVEPFYILTNGEASRAIKDYSYRFGAIEFLFKAQKSNGNFLEETQIKDLYTFNSLYTCLCISQTLLTILGIDYSKNTKSYKDFHIRNARIVKCKRRKDYSFFHIGLILLQFSLMSNCGIKLFNRLILYDV